MEEFNRMICAIFECQHFVDNSQLQHFRFHFRSHSDFSTARTVKINIFVEINTMSLTNIAVIKEPTIRMPAKLSLTTIGLTTRAIKLSSVVNATCLAPQAFPRRDLQQRHGNVVALHHNRTPRSHEGCGNRTDQGDQWGQHSCRVLTR